MADQYAIAYTPAGFAYVRQVLGTRPYDEVAALIANIEAQKAQQDAPSAPESEPDPPSVIRTDGWERGRERALRGRPRKSAPPNGNGAAHPDAPDAL